MTPQALLQMRGVHTHIGAYHILQGVDLLVPAGKLTALLGRNGVGKTTTLRTIMGLWRASAGSIDFKGQSITQAQTPDIARSGISYVPENMGIFSDLTVRENMLLAAHKAPSVEAMDAQRLRWIWELFPAVEKFWSHPAGKLSGGQKQMLALARALIEPRELLIVDEPSKGLAPAIVNNLVAALSEVKKQGASVLLVEQNVSVAQRVADHVVVMDQGRTVYQGSVEEFEENEDLRASYLGLSL